MSNVSYARYPQYVGYWCSAVAYYRKKRGLTQSQLGDKVGLSKNSISTVELAQTVPSTKFAIRISQVLDIPIDRLFWEE